MDYKKAFYSKLEECYLGAKIKAYEKAHTAQSTTSNIQDKANETATTAQSGFSNLLSIKEQYFSHIKAYLDSAIPNDDFNSHDIYNKLYTFFDSYLNDTGTPFFHDTPLYKNIYAKVYTNSKDTSLFYKTKDNKLYTFFDSYLNDTGTPFFHDTPLYKNIYAKVYTNSKDTSLFYKTKDLYYVKSDTLYTSLTLSDENELTQISLIQVSIGKMPIIPSESLFSNLIK